MSFVLLLLVPGVDVSYEGADAKLGKSLETGTRGYFGVGNRYGYRTFLKNC